MVYVSKAFSGLFSVFRIGRGLTYWDGAPACQRFEWQIGIPVCDSGATSSRLFSSLQTNGQYDTHFVDKVIGAMLSQEDFDPKQHILLVSGRAGFELVQKAVVAQIPAMAAVGAPSSLAVKLAASYNLTLMGFVRNGRFNVYSAKDRIV